MAIREKITHGIVRTLPKELALKTGEYAYIDLYFGPGEGSAILGIAYRKTGPRQWSFVAPRTRLINREGVTEEIPVFAGDVWVSDISPLCAFYLDRIKTAVGSFAHDKTYRVTTATAVEIPK